MKKVELMAPAGTKEAFIGAINAGANAIYMAGKKFGARAFAANFELSEIKELTKYAHLRNVLVYITINTLIFDEEVESVLSYVDRLIDCDVDALIVQDLGMLDLIHRLYPTVTLHASTQINAHNVEQVKFLKELGASRVILARETSIDVVKEIKKNVDIEVEVFVHGALCVSYSGNCLFSSMVGHRSGNRGECGQLCRLPYTMLKDGVAISEEAYLMSTKDLMTLPRLDELLDSPIDAFKIEGRMRKADYVIQSVLSYRKVIDARIQNNVVNIPEEIDKLKRVFNRDYTEGYVLNAKPYTLNNPFRPNHMGVEVGKVLTFSRGKATIKLSGELSVNDGIRIIGETDTGDVVSRIVKGGELVPTAYAGDIIVLDSGQVVASGSTVLKTLDHDLVKSLEEYLDPDFKMIPIFGTAKVFVGKPLYLKIEDEDGNRAEVESDFVALPAQTAFATIQSIENQLTKLGNTPFVWGSLTAETDELCFVPVKAMNELRRLAIEKISDLRSAFRHEKVVVPEEKQAGMFVKEPFELIAKIRTLDQLESAVAQGLKTIYYEDALVFDKALYPGITFYEVKRRIWPDSAKFVVDTDSVVSEVGSIEIGKNHRLVGDNFLNVTNIYTANLLARSGLKSLTLSLEMHQENIRNFARLYQEKFGVLPNLEMIVYGHTELMISKYCPIAKTTGVNKTHCRLCEFNQYALKDRMDYEFPLVNDGDCNIRVLNPKPLCLIDSVAFMQEAAIAKIRMDFTVETRKETDEMIQAFQHALRKEMFLVNRHDMTYGRFLK